MFKSRADQISHTLPTTRHRSDLDAWAQTQSRGDEHRSLVTPERVLSEINEDLIFLILLIIRVYHILFTTVVFLSASKDTINF